MNRIKEVLRALRNLQTTVRQAGISLEMISLSILAFPAFSLAGPRSHWSLVAFGASLDCRGQSSTAITLWTDPAAADSPCTGQKLEVHFSTYLPACLPTQSPRSRITDAKRTRVRRTPLPPRFIAKAPDGASCIHDFDGIVHAVSSRFLTGTWTT